MSLAQNLKRSGILRAGVRIKTATTSSSTPSTSEEPAPAIHAPQASRSINELEGALVLLVVVGVLVSTGTHLADVLVHVTTVSVRRSSPVRNLDEVKKKLVKTTFQDALDVNQFETANKQIRVKLFLFVN